MKKMQKILSLILALSMMLGMMAFAASADEVNVAKIGDVEYATLKDAVDAANGMENGATITLLTNVELGEKLTISRNITITGAMTITRADGYTGTLFAVATGATLTLGDIIIDGGNEWTLLLDEYLNTLRSGEMIPDNAVEAHNRFVQLENDLVANAAVFAVSGNMVLNSGTVIQNHALANGGGKYVFSVAAGATLTMNGPVLKHNTKIGSHTLLNVSADGTCVVNNAEITDNFGFGNGCIASTDGKLYINNIDFHTNYGTSNGMFRVYEAKGYMEVNGGEFYNNFMIADKSNNWNGMVYVHNTGATFVMNDGVMTKNYTTECGGVSAKQNGTSSIIINGGKFEDNVVYTGRFGPGKDFLLGNPLQIGEDKCVDSKEVRLYNDFVNNGILNANTVYMHGWANIKNGARVYSGDGIINGNVYLHGGAKTTMESGTWNGLVTVDDIDTATSLTVKAGATIMGVQIRVLNSVESGDYLSVEEAAAAQAAAYVKEDGANVTSPVLYYHRLAAGQKQNIVVTFDYNGGLDAQGWSGCQLTGAEAFAPACPAPTKGNLKLIGWKYAVDNNPECLTMEGTTDYAGEVITQSVRLIAQWGTEEQKVTVNYVDNKGNVLASQEVQTLAAGSNYEAIAKKISGYLQTSHTGTASGIIGDEDVVVTFIYTKVWNLTVNYVDENGNVLAEQIVSPRLEGAKYTTVAKEIEGYVVTEVPENATSTILGDTVVTYVYAAEKATEPSEPETEPTQPSEPEEEITEPSVPLAPTPSEPETSEPTVPSEPEEEIPDESVPLAPNPNEPPKTGDNTNLMGAIIVAMASISMAVLVLSKKKNFFN